MAEIFPPRVTSNIPPAYGATDTTGYSETGTATFTNASTSFTTTSTNTVWCVEITADITPPPGVGSEQGIVLQVGVDGTYTSTDGALKVIANYNGPVLTRTVVGQKVVTLSTAATHTVSARSIRTTGSATIAYGIVTVTAKQLAG
jgi:hypothetical protein